jgi:hypothetical protein
MRFSQNPEARWTLPRMRWPDTPEFGAAAQRLHEGAAAELIRAIWDGYELFRIEVLSPIEISRVEEEIERSITQSLTPRIRRSLSAFAPFEVEQGVYEFETRLPAPAQPPLYDIAFVLRGNERIMWPLEAKVLRTENTVSPYVDDVREQFLTCRYAPFSQSAGMLGYLLVGQPSNVFAKIAARLGKPLLSESGGRAEHRVSHHTRLVPPGKDYPSSFACHHLILQMSVQ